MTRVLSGADIQKSRSSGIVMLAGTYGILDKNCYDVFSYT